jgi:hypothetical protein
MGVPPNRFIGVGLDPNNNNNNFPPCNMAGIPTYTMNIPEQNYLMEFHKICFHKGLLLDLIRTSGNFKL